MCPQRGARVYMPPQALIHVAPRRCYHRVLCDIRYVGSRANLNQRVAGPGKETFRFREMRSYLVSSPPPQAPPHVSHLEVVGA